MNQISNKIIDIVDTFQSGMFNNTEDAIIFFNGYLTAMRDLKIIDELESRYYKKFLRELIDKMFVEKE